MQSILPKLRQRDVHGWVLQYCNEELLKENYFHAVLEATKSLAEQVWQLTNLKEDETTLYDKAFSTSTPYLVLKPVWRYSLDVEGLVYAGGEWDASKYVTLQPVKDNVLLLCDEEYFGENGLVNRIAEFVRVVYGADAGRKPCVYCQGIGKQGQYQP